MCCQVRSTSCRILLDVFRLIACSSFAGPRYVSETSDLAALLQSDAAKELFKGADGPGSAAER